MKFSGTSRPRGALATMMKLLACQVVVAIALVACDGEKPQTPPAEAPADVPSVQMQASPPVAMLAPEVAPELAEAAEPAAEPTDPEAPLEIKACDAYVTALRSCLPTMTELVRTEQTAVLARQVAAWREAAATPTLAAALPEACEAAKAAAAIVLPDCSALQSPKGMKVRN